MKLAERMSQWSAAERAGRAARIAGVPLSANPYQVKDKALAYYWDRGWLRAFVEQTAQGDFKLADGSDAAAGPRGSSGVGRVDPKTHPLMREDGE